MNNSISVLVSKSELFLYKVLTRFSIDMALEFDSALVDTSMEGGVIPEKLPRADIVILSYELPLTSPELVQLYETCRRITTTHPCHLILACDGQQFAQCFSVLQNVVDSFLLKPFLIDDIYSVLRKTISMVVSGEAPLSSRVALSDLHSFFLNYACRLERATPVTPAYINRVYQTHIQKGVYRGVFIKWEHSDTFLKTQAATSVAGHNIHLRIEEIVCEEMSSICWELLFSKLFDGVTILTNYSEKRDSEVLRGLSRILRRVRTIITGPTDFHVTICAGCALNDVNDLELTFESAHMASWHRRFVGVDRVILSAEPPCILPAASYDELRVLSDEVLKSITALDSARFRSAVRGVFSLPAQVLMTAHAKKQIIYWREKLFEAHREHIHMIDDPDDFQTMLKYELSFTHTFAAFAYIYENQLASLIDRINDVIKDHRSPPVAIAMEYVRNHYSQKISLHLVAEVVHLNPNYFSNLFKKEMKIGFTAYVRNYRLRVARELLSHSQMRLEEVASSVGLSAEQMGKCFREIQGLSPSEYRKVYWQSPDAPA